MVKIGMISTWNVKCGIATYSNDLANALAQEGAEIYIVRLPRFGWKNGDIVADVAGRVPFDKVDIISVQHEYGLYQGWEEQFYRVLREGKKPIITTMHAVGNWQTDKIISDNSDRVIVHNEFCRKRFDFPSTIIHHGLTPSICTPMEQAKKGYGIDSKIPVVGYLGFISNYKGLETLIEAMTKVPNTGLLVAGGWHTDTDTPYIEKLKTDSLKALPSRVQWLGYIEDDKLADAYGAMDILVYPSRFATESGALLHGIAYGKAIIASDLPPFREKAEEGVITTFKNIDDLAAGIKVLLTDEPTRKGYEEAAKKYAENNSWTEIAKEHMELFNYVLEGRNVSDSARRKIKPTIGAGQPHHEAIRSE